MTRIAVSMAVTVMLFGCEPTAEISEPGMPTTGGGLPSSGSSSSAPLFAEPFLPSLSPHRLAISGDVVLVADPEGSNSDGRHPQVHVLQLSTGTRVASIELPDGANPGAVEINPVTGFGYVVARGAGGIFALDLSSHKIANFIPTCAAPIDLASQGSTSQAATMRRYQNKISVAAWIGLDDPITRSGVQTLESVGLIAGGRALQILDAPVQPGERPGGI